MTMSFTLAVPKGVFAAVIGPSGSGKSTLLSLIAGFERPLSGHVSLDGEDMTDVPPDKRPVNMIFQDNNVFPHLDLWQNVAIGVAPSLRLTAQQTLAVDAALKRVGLFDLKHRKPGDVSGGERQRVAIARALVRDRPILLLDEPFAALGPGLRADMLGLLSDVQKERGLTVLMVTHQPEDALAAASLTIFIADGRVRAARPTQELFEATDLPDLRAYLGDWRSERR
ncbi:ATP-binding cassette domain-containing protein [Aestuariivirga sp.]|uniref:thiamine ABC transporter ATP-binding protein n=1 Tax=Aestuariivirga sp. TaxID=2650926 RepID=UPI0039E69015